MELQDVVLGMKSVRVINQTSDVSVCVKMETSFDCQSGWQLCEILSRVPDRHELAN